jgi:hypothetical protein
MTKKKLPQMFYPGMPELSQPWTGDYEVVWSIYLRCNNKQKLNRIHIPALEAIIGQPHGGRGWVIEKESENPDEVRLMTIEVLSGPYSVVMLTALLSKLYALRTEWRIAARLDEEHPHGVYVCAIYTEGQSDGSVPPVSNAMVELQPDFSPLIDGETARLSGTGKPFSC